MQHYIATYQRASGSIIGEDDHREAEYDARVYAAIDDADASWMAYTDPLVSDGWECTGYRLLDAVVKANMVDEF